MTVSSTEKKLARALKLWPVFFSINISSTSRSTVAAMASLRPCTRKDGSTFVQVLYRLGGKQTSTSFEDLVAATKFKAAQVPPRCEARSSVLVQPGSPSASR